MLEEDLRWRGVRVWAWGGGLGAGEEGDFEDGMGGSEKGEGGGGEVRKSWQ